MKSKTARAFELFEEGKTFASPEVKRLGLKYSSRRSLYSRWKHEQEPTLEPDAEGTTALPKGESIGGIDEVKAEKEVKEELAPEGVKEEELEPKEVKPEIPISLGEAEKEKGEVVIPENIIGEGLPIRVRVSVKTLALYQIAYTVAGNNLSLGDFIDDCVADFFKGRGQDLGLVKIERR